MWYSTTPVGHNTLAKTVKRLCETAGISGYKTNHSLRVTNATRLFQSGIDEQLIMARTGHRSLEGVRAYKRVSTDQKQSVSRILNSATNGKQADSTAGLPDVKKPKIEVKAGPNTLEFNQAIYTPTFFLRLHPYLILSTAQTNKYDD